MISKKGLSNTLSVQDMLFQFLGGLGLFLFGIKYLGEGLQNSAGDRLRNILDSLTTNPYTGVLTGLFFTILIQSSSATTVMTVGLVNARMLTLRQAVGIIMGANIGTTFTTFIIGFDAAAFGLPLLAVGGFFVFFIRSYKYISIGRILFGLGALFFGIQLKASGIEPLQVLDFKNLNDHLNDQPFLGIAIGTLATMFMQSSSATVGILQQMFSMDWIHLNGALAVLFGENIGTTITAVIAAIGASQNAKRAALVHVLFNVIGTVIFFIFFIPYKSIIEWFARTMNLQPAMEIAFAHGFFNVASVIILFPFISLLVYAVTRLIRDDEWTVDTQTVKLDEKVINSSAEFALHQARQELLKMAAYSRDGLRLALLFFQTRKNRYADTAMQYEEEINRFDRQITKFLVKLSIHSLSKNESTEHTMLLNLCKDIERVGDHMKNMIDLVCFMARNNIKLSEVTSRDFENMMILTQSCLEKAIKALETNNKFMAEEVLSIEDDIDEMERTLRKKHIQDINNNLSTGQESVVYVDFISNLERIGDHSVNIAEAVLER
ncbi:sodium-dependent phosphate transporter [Fictibacillus enclensis]|uniref:Sodium-dependent phosphate transporter n=1 Tax=Fictibacillus enclensis TaxID=1017270 RepID=A0A0V8JFD1_9BACL|nr:Na/Pi cotransporter family protein [Fictibacillus enclensis]KSU85774.1 sodium-dependent phosphate transporter [Fictibacillus enclensis]